MCLTGTNKEDKKMKEKDIKEINKELLRIAKKHKKDRTKEESKFIKNQIEKIPVMDTEILLKKIRTEIDQYLKSIEMIKILGKEIVGIN